MEVQRDLEIPRKKAYSNNSKYEAVRNLQVGECLFFEGAKSQTKREVDTSRRILRRMGRKPVVRKCADGMRVWRTE